MQAAPARYVSVSELYSTDEVELLLDEIRDLEPTSCRGEDVQDFEIAGSGCVSGGGGGGGGGRSPAGTEVTERSWDSHAGYRRGAAAGAPGANALAPLYCHTRHLLSVVGTSSVCVAACGVAACACAWAAAGPRVPRALRPLLLAALTSALLHTALLFVHITRLTLLLPIDWNKLGICAGLWSLSSLCCGASLSLPTAAGLLPAHETAWRLLYSAAGIGYVGAFGALVLVGAHFHAWAVQRRAGRGGATRGGGGARGAYRAVPAAPPDPRPSTSRDHPL